MKKREQLACLDDAGFQAVEEVLGMMAQLAPLADFQLKGPQ